MLRAPKPKPKKTPQELHSIPECLHRACKCPHAGCECWMFKAELGWVCPMGHGGIIMNDHFLSRLHRAMNEHKGKHRLRYVHSLVRRLVWWQKRRKGWK